MWQAGAKDAIGDFRGPLRRPIDLHASYPCEEEEEACVKDEDNRRPVPLPNYIYSD